MSGLRETIRRRGGLELTSRVVGGLWVVGQRTVPSPYNAAATAALMAAFPTQWPTIRDYGWQHEEIVGYMNAYAPEDAKIAYSLVEGIGVRKTKTINSNRGNGAYIDAGWPFEEGWELTIKFGKMTNDGSSGSQWVPIMGSGGYSPSKYNRTAFINTTINKLSIDTEYLGNSSSAELYNPNGVNVLKMTATGAVFNGVTLTYGRDGNTKIEEPPTPHNLFLFCSNNSPKTWRGDTEIVAYEFRVNGVLKQGYYPFIRNGVKAMIDVVSGVFHPNDNSVGAFDISETPPS